MIYIIMNDYFGYLYKDVGEALKRLSPFNGEEIKILKLKWKIKENLFGKVIRKVTSKIKRVEWILDNSEINNTIFSHSDYVIFFDIYEEQFLKIIRKKTKNSKEIFWLWNKIDHQYIYKLKETSKNIWSFDGRDARETGINYTSQFYWREKEKNTREEYVIYFIGQNKGREEQVLNIKRNLKNINFKVQIVLKKYRFDLIRYILKNKKERLNYSLENIPYEQVVEEIKKSKSILELTKKDQEGLTLRALESLFYEKKLITDNEKIEKYDFYNLNNIFILKKGKIADSEQINEIEKFLSSEYKEISEDIKEKYTIKTWLEKLIKNYI